MIHCVIATFNFNPCYAYESECISVCWEIDGLLIRRASEGCLIDGEPCYAGQVIPWSDLLPKRKVTLSSDGEEFGIAFSVPRDESSWLRYIKKGFPFDIRIKALNAYFAVNYIQKQLSGTLYPDFFTSCLNAYRELGLGPNDQMVALWNARYIKYLVSSFASTDENKILESVVEIKNHILR